MGAKIEGAGTRRLIIEGVKNCTASARHHPDRIEQEHFGGGQLPVRK